METVGPKLHSHENHDFDTLSSVGDFGLVGVDAFELEEEFLDNEVFFPSSVEDLRSSVPLRVVTLVFVSRCISHS